MLAIKEEKTYSNRRLAPTGFVGHQPFLGTATHFAAFLPPADDALDDFVDRKCRRIENWLVRRGNERRDRPLGVALVALPQIAGKGAQISIDSFFYQLLIAPLGPDFRVGCQ